MRRSRRRHACRPVGRLPKGWQKERPPSGAAGRNDDRKAENAELADALRYFGAPFASIASDDARSRRASSRNGSPRHSMAAPTR